MLVARRSLLLLAVLLPAAVHAARPAACPGGTYVVTGAPLVAAQATPPGELVTIAGGTIATNSGCPAVPVKLKGRKNGTTRVTAKWTKKTPCDALGGAAVLKATLADGCASLTGTLTAKKASPKKRTLAAQQVVCGDGVTAGPEECDDGNAVETDGCSAQCRVIQCGDGRVDGAEQCDAGAGNSDTTPDACRTDCTSPRCGDGVHDGAEACDDGNADAGDGCDPTCATATCLVPVTHATIQAGIDDAACATVWVEAGTYTERPMIARDVHVRRSGPGTVVVDGDAGGSVVSITNGIVGLRDLEIRNGLAETGGGIYVAAPSALTLTNVLVHGNLAQGTAALGGGLYSLAADVTLDGSTVTENTASGTGAADPVTAAGGGIWASGGTLTLLNASVVSANTVTATGVGADAEVQGGGIAGSNAGVAIALGSAVNGNLAEATSDARATAEGGGIAVSGGNLEVATSSTVDLNEARARGNDTWAYGGGVFASGTTVTIMDGARVEANTASAEGAGVATANGGGIVVETGTTLSVVTAVVKDNVADAHCLATGASLSAQAEGGGIWMYAGGGACSTSVLQGTISGNQATALVTGEEVGTAKGGGVNLFAATGSDSAVLRLERSTLSGNTAQADGAGQGGGVSLFAATGAAVSRFVATNATLAGNLANATLIASGGAIHATTGTGGAKSEVILNNATVAGNTATGASSAGGGIAGDRGISSSTVPMTARNSVIAYNEADDGPDCRTEDTTLTSAAYNLIGDATNCTLGGDVTGNLLGVSPLLEALADNGGPTLTRMPLDVSPLVNAANPAGCKDETGADLTEDQRGTARPLGVRCDMGAVERE